MIGDSEGANLPAISVIFWDIGGVLLSNAWDRTQREQALKHFSLDWDEFQDRHEMVVSSWERGKITLHEYLDRTVFYRTRSFTPEAFREYMFSLSTPDNETLALVRELKQLGRFTMATLNNESRELNVNRIQTFGLRDIFSLFVSSCYVGCRKPEEAIYRMALELVQTPAEQCCFIDDRALNIESAAKLGMRTIRKQSADQLRKDLRTLGLSC
jgi:putative hydrolase of the HAD superfamily